MKHYHTVLSIAGSDSCGGAGIQADIKTCTALGVYAMTAITALTAQNTCGVHCFEATSADMLHAQLETVVEDILPDAIKTGMLPSAAAVRLVAEFIRTYKLNNLVVDPVMVATSGDNLCEDETRTAFLEELLPLARVITPNIPEAEVLTGLKISDRESMKDAATELLIATGCEAVLLKGGHGIERGRHADLLLHSVAGTTSPQALWLEHPHIDTPNTHGTGCTLSSAIASFLARGSEVQPAVERAVDWLAGAIKAGADFELGHGHGPVNHLYEIN